MQKFLVEIQEIPSMPNSFKGFEKGIYILGDTVFFCDGINDYAYSIYVPNGYVLMNQINKSKVIDESTPDLPVVFNDSLKVNDVMKLIAIIRCSPDAITPNDFSAPSNA